MLLSFFILVEHPFINLDPDIGSPGIWFISLSFAVTHIALNLYIRMKWKRGALNDPKPFHWTLSYVIYVIPVSLICSFLLSLLHVVLPPLSSPLEELIFLSLLILVISSVITIVFLPSLDFILVFLGIIRLFELILFPKGLPVEIAGFTVIGFLLCCLLFFPLVPVGLFYSKEIMKKIHLIQNKNHN